MQLVRRIVVVDDHRSFAEALGMALDVQADLTCVGIAGTAQEGLDAARRLRPDVIVTDLGLPDRPGQEFARDVRSLLPGVPVVALTAHADGQAITLAASAGICALFRKEASLAEIIRGVRNAADGDLLVDVTTMDLAMRSQWPDRGAAVHGPRLTPREQEVLALLQQAFDVRSIAKELAISIHTARDHMKSLLAKFDVHTQVELLVRAAETGAQGAGFAPPPQRRPAMAQAG